MSSIWVVCKDAGGTNNLLPILPLLRNAGHEVKLFLHEGGKGETSIKTANEPFEAVNTAEEVIQKYGKPNLLVTSMCSDGGVGRDLIPILRDLDAPTAAIQDFWGGRLNTDFKNKKFHPDLITINDKAGFVIVHNVWGRRQTDTLVAVTGYPRLDAFANLNRAKLEESGRELYGIRDDLPIVLYSGQIWHAGSMLEKVVQSLNHIKIPCHLLTSRHPRMATEAPEEETKMWRWAETSVDSHVRLHREAKSNLETILVSSVVVGQYTTVLVDAAALGKQNISLLYPEYGASAFQREFGGVMEEFPLVSLGCTAEVKNDRELRETFARALGKGLNLESDQAETFRLDGRNSLRTVEKILDLL